MSEIKIILPKLGESIVSATVVQWFKKEGDSVALDEPLLEVSTDKVNSEIPSPASGILKEILVKVDEEVDVGAPLALVSDQGAVQEEKEIARNEGKAKEQEEKDGFLSPAVMRLVQEKGIPLSELDRIPRKTARLTKKDIENYKTSPFQEKEGSEIIKMSGLRKAISENITTSYREIPHASLTTEVDVTDLVKGIQENKQRFLDQHGIKISITAFAARAIIKAVTKFPLLNSSITGDTIILKKFIHLGMAVGVDQGVIVPILKHAEKLNIVDFAKKIADLSVRSRENKLKPDEVQEGSITMTNFGITGVPFGTPIIRYPEVAIIGLGAISKKVLVMPDETTAIRSTCWVSVTFDHRVLDGIYGCGFLNVIKEELETGFLVEET